MEYPTLEEVNVASHEQICEWLRFLESPGMSVVDSDPDQFYVVGEKERVIMDRIIGRNKEFGGFTPEISKKIGWVRR